MLQYGERKRTILAFTLFFISQDVIQGHGQMNYPPSTRQGFQGETWPGALSGQGAGGYCEQPDGTAFNATYHNQLNGACMLFSQPNAEQQNVSIIPGEPTLNAAQYRTVNINISSGPLDWTRQMPWRWPGSANVLGSGCGVAGGGDMWNPNGGWPATGMKLGQDPVEVLPKASNPPVWAKGSVVTVAFGIWANHGGGYSYRLCKNEPGEVSEACFQRTPLAFSGSTTWLQHINGTRIEIPRVTVTDGTFPEGSQWARVPFPECADLNDKTAKPQYAASFGDNCEHFQYAEPIPNTHGFGHNNSTKVMDGFHDYSIVDKVVLPKDLPGGDYLLSWRWDAEQTTQIWQNCADVTIF